jgi:hypothetical protein
MPLPANSTAGVGIVMNIVRVVITGNFVGFKAGSRLGHRHMLLLLLMLLVVLKMVRHQWVGSHASIGRRQWLKMRIRHILVSSMREHHLK